jgi:hypothetical protein
MKGNLRGKKTEEASDKTGINNNWQGVVLFGQLKMPCFNSNSHQTRQVILTSESKCPECGRCLTGAILPQVI